MGGFWSRHGQPRGVRVWTSGSTCPYFTVILFFTAARNMVAGALTPRISPTIPYSGSHSCLFRSVDIARRMVIDVSLAALCVGWAWYNLRETTRGRVCSCWQPQGMSRETGLILVAAQVSLDVPELRVAPFADYGHVSFCPCFFGTTTFLFTCRGVRYRLRFVSVLRIFLRLLHPNHYPFRCRLRLPSR